MENVAGARAVPVEEAGSGDLVEMITIVFGATDESAMTEDVADVITIVVGATDEGAMSEDIALAGSKKLITEGNTRAGA